MMPQYHFTVSVTISLTFFIYTKSPTASLLCFLAGFMLDADHLIDFWMYKRKLTLSREIFQGFYEKWDKVPVLLHSIELLILIALLALLFPSVSLPLLGIAVGFISHLILDFMSYELHPLSYFLIYRVTKRFDKRYICAKHKTNEDQEGKL